METKTTVKNVNEIFNLLDLEYNKTPLREEQGLEDILNLINEKKEDFKKEEDLYNLNFDFLKNN